MTNSTMTSFAGIPALLSRRHITVNCRSLKDGSEHGFDAEVADWVRRYMDAEKACNSIDFEGVASFGDIDQTLDVIVRIHRDARVDVIPVH